MKDQRDDERIDEGSEARRIDDRSA